jgi:uncharacterized membrane protein YgdD (TMEM256/DUF423 family)
MTSTFTLLGALCAFLGVSFGAFGAHALKTFISADALAIFQTGVNYQMWHALGLVGIGCLHQQNQDAGLLPWAGWIMFIGIVLFSGSLYALAILNLTWLGMITPLGGVCFLLAWLLLFFSFYQRKITHRYR